MLLKLPHHHRQMSDYTCGPAALQMVFGYFKKRIAQETIAKRAGTSKKNGTSHKGMITAARAAGFSARASSRGTLAALARTLDKNIPVIVNYVEPEENEGHYAIAIGAGKKNVTLNDPWHGPRFAMKTTEFLKRWKKRNCWQLILSPKTLKKTGK